MKNILCVDDEHDVVSLLSCMLQRRGYRVVGHEDAPSTRKLVDQHGFDLVILDVMMPGMSGLEVFDDLKASYGELPMLFVTGRPHSFDLDHPGNERRWRHGFVDGRTDILYKPFRADDLLEKVDGLVGPP